MKLKSWIFPLLLVLAVFAIYSNAYTGAFLYDDEFLVIRNKFLDSWSTFGAIFQNPSTGGAGFSDSFYRPLQTVCYLIINQVFGREPWAFHLLNISFHALNAVLVYVLAFRLGVKKTYAFFGALLWAVHPLHTEAVTYISATADTLSVVFILSALITMTPVLSAKGIIIGLTFAACAFLTKEGALTFPALFVSILFISKQDRWKLKTYLPTIPFWILAGAYFLMRKTILAFSNDLAMYKEANVYTESLTARFYTFLATLPQYLDLIVWPHNLHMDRAFPVYIDFLLNDVLLGFAIFLIAIFALIRVIFKPNDQRSLWSSFVVLWMAAAYAPSSGLLIPANSFFLEHWMYLPTIALAIAGARGFEEIQIKTNLQKVTVAVLIAVIVLSLGFMTFEQNEVWQTPISFFGNILKYNPKADRVRHNLAMAYSDAGDDDHALAEYKMVIERTQSYPATFHNMGRIYFKKNQYDLAIEYENKALALDPKFYPAYGSLAEIYAFKGEKAKSEEAKRKYLEITH